jgi:hypothetical protein
MMTSRGNLKKLRNMPTTVPFCFGFCGLLNNAFSIETIVLDGRMNDDELERIWKEIVTA